MEAVVLEVSATGEIVVVAPATGEIVVVSPATSDVVYVAPQVGPRGDPGPAGAVGPDSFYTHNQITPSLLWNVTHTMPGHPSVTTVDSAGSVVIGDVTYVSATEITIGFSAPFAGSAHLS